MQSIPLSRDIKADGVSATGLSPQRAMVLFGLALTSGVFAIAWWGNLRLGAYLDHIEGNIAIGGWLWAHGAQLYALQDGYAQFANIYGPLAYLAAVPAMLLAGPTVFASKILSSIAVVATLALTLHRYRRATSMASVQAMFFMIAALTALTPMSIWIRADPFEMLLVAAGLAGAASPAFVGVCIGLAVNFKVHAFLYFLPILWQLWTRRGCRAAPPVVVCSLATFFAPFLLPGISLHDYLAMMTQQIGSRTRHYELLVPVAAYCAALSLPVLLPLCRRRVPSADRYFGIAVLASLALAAYPATFPGAGPYHLLPLLPLLVEARHRLNPQGIGAEFSVFPLLFFAATTTSLTFTRTHDHQVWPAYADEALQLARQAPPGSVVDIGYGDNQRSYEIAQLAKTELSFNGFPRRIDAQILMELKKTEIDGARRWIPYLTQCQVGRWIMPRGEEPFAARSYFYDNVLLFDDAFRQAFAANYRPVADSEHFTVWECAHEPR